MEGIGASSGIAIGSVHIIKKETFEILKVNGYTVDHEINRYNEAAAIAKTDLEKLFEMTLEKVGEHEAQIFVAHKELISDPVMNKEVVDFIEAERCSTEYAFNEIINKYILMFNSLDNEYMKERALDLKDIKTRVLRLLFGYVSTSLEDIEGRIIVFAEDLTPSDTVKLDKSKVCGFVTAIGGKTSHTAIMARTMGIPAIVGIGNAFESVDDRAECIIDGDTGAIIFNPDEAVKKEYKLKKREQEEYHNALKEYIGVETKTLDGKSVEVAANIANVEDAEYATENDAEGVGLFRSEFLYMNRDSLPTEEEQFKAYSDVLKELDGKPVIIRTMDIGGDKEVDYLNLPKEMNPFLGYRAIRICLDRVDLFKTQLRAMLRASVYGTLKIMFPMISSLEELRKSKEILEEAKSELRVEGVEFSEDVQVGIMIEVPSAVLLSDMFAKEVDFFSIGTNDLLQYLTATDRMNQNLKEHYTPYNPALLHSIKMIIDNGHKNGIWVGMCGSLAGDPLLVPLLLGMGLDEFSMSPTAVLKVRKLINGLSVEGLQELVGTVLSYSTAVEVRQELEVFGNLL